MNGAVVAVNGAVEAQNVNSKALNGFTGNLGILGPFVQVPPSPNVYSSLLIPRLRKDWGLGVPRSRILLAEDPGRPGESSGHTETFVAVRLLVGGLNGATSADNGDQHRGTSLPLLELVSDGAALKVVARVNWLRLRCESNRPF